MLFKEVALRWLWLQSRSKHTSSLLFNTVQTTKQQYGGGGINSASVVEEERWSQLEGPGGGDEVRRPIDVLYIVMNVGTVWGAVGGEPVEGGKCKWREDKSRPRLTISIAVNLAARRKTGS